MLSVYWWDFNDTTPTQNVTGYEAGRQQVHSFVSAGVYNVTVRAFSSEGSSSRTLPISVFGTVHVLTCIASCNLYVLFSPDPITDISVTDMPAVARFNSFISLRLHSYTQNNRPYRGLINLAVISANGSTLTTTMNSSTEGVDMLKVQLDLDQVLSSKMNFTIVVSNQVSRVSLNSTVSLAGQLMRSSSVQDNLSFLFSPR